MLDTISMAQFHKNEKKNLAAKLNLKELSGMQNSIFMVQSANSNTYFAIFSQVSRKKLN